MPYPRIKYTLYYDKLIETNVAIRFECMHSTQLNSEPHCESLFYGLYGLYGITTNRL